MTEKRFEIMVGGMVWDNHVDEDRQLSRDEVVDLLNTQHEQIQILTTTNGEMEDYLARLEEENKDLKKKLECITNSLQTQLNNHGRG